MVGQKGGKTGKKGTIGELAVLEAEELLSIGWAEPEVTFIELTELHRCLSMHECGPSDTFHLIHVCKQHPKA